MFSVWSKQRITRTTKDFEIGIDGGMMEKFLPWRDKIQGPHGHAIDEVGGSGERVSPIV